jgi:hypothetical protein
MSTRICELKVKNFVGLQSADLAFEKPVSLFVGRNNQGKSSIRDALLFALTGKCRGLTKFKDVSSLAHNGQKDMAVSLVVDDGTILVRTCKNASEGVADNGSVIPYCLIPQSFIALPAKDRCKLLADVLGGEESVVEAAISQHVGDFPEPILKELNLLCVDIHDVDAIRKGIIEIRRQYKRILAELHTEPPNIKEYKLPEGYDPTPDAEAVKALAARIAKGGELLAAVKEQNMAEARILDAKTAIRRAKEAKKPVPDLPPDVDQERLNDTSLWVNVLEKILGSAKNGKCVCPVCDKESPGEILQQRYDALSIWLAQYVAKIAERKAVEVANAKLDAEIEAGEKLIKALSKGLVKVEAPKNGDGLLSSLTAERDALQDKLRTYERYQHDLGVFEQHAKQKPGLEVLIAECNRIDKALEDGGPVKAAIAAGGKKLPINEKLLDAWDMRGLQWSDNGEIALKGRPIEYASDSEKYRAGCVMGLALACVADVGFAALDGFEILVGDNANGFFDAVEECGLGNIFVFASSAKDYRGVEQNPNMDIFEVVDGKVTRL